uniref:Uncharacterized protein n=1 Tax=Avena sativa TaxID=4498 RepID=A0ACD6ATR6_AVESA
MTANHVVEFYDADEHDKLRIRLPESDQEFEGEILEQDDFKDLALISVLGMPDGYPALRFSRETTLPLETDAVLVAYYQPENLAGSKNSIPKKPGACPGKIVGPPIRDTNQVDWTERIRHDCACMSGTSGGPVITNGRVIGVNVCGDVQTGQAASFVTVEAVVKVWAGYSEEEDGDLTVEDLFNRY